VANLRETICRNKYRKGIGIGAREAKRKGMSEEEYIALCSKLSKKVLLTILKVLFP